MLGIWQVYDGDEIEDIFEDIMGAQCGYDGNLAIKTGDIM